MTATQKQKKLIIFGSAELATLAHYYFSIDSDYEVVAFCVDDEFVTQGKINKLPIIPFSQIKKQFPPDSFEMHVAISYAQFNELRREKYLQAKKAGYKLASYICSRGVYWPDLSIGDNCFILENQTIQPTVKIGSNVVVWSGNHVGHGSIIHDHVYISSHVVICGHCNIGPKSFIGVNASIRDFASVGEQCFIGMGGIVTKDLPNESVVIANSFEALKKEDRRAKFILRSFFK